MFRASNEQWAIGALDTNARKGVSWYRIPTKLSIERSVCKLVYCLSWRLLYGIVMVLLLLQPLWLLQYMLRCSPMGWNVEYWFINLLIYFISILFAHTWYDSMSMERRIGLRSWAFTELTGQLGILWLRSTWFISSYGCAIGFGICGLYSSPVIGHLAVRALVCA